MVKKGKPNEGFRKKSIQGGWRREVLNAPEAVNPKRRWKLSKKKNWGLTC